MFLISVYSFLVAGGSLGACQAVIGLVVHVHLWLVRAFRASLWLLSSFRTHVSLHAIELVRCLDSLDAVIALVALCAVVFRRSTC